MPTYSIQAPDGTTVRVQANDPQSAMQAAQRQWAQSQGGPRSSTPPAGAPRRQAQPPAKQDGLLDMANGAIRSFAEGFPVAGGLANRANAALAATVAPAVEPMLDMIPGHDRGQDVTPGGGDWQGRYDRALALQNGTDAKFQAQHPNVATTAGVAGNVIGSYALARGFGVPAGAPLKPAPSVLGRLVNGGKTVLGGTAIGAADGAARAPDGQQAQGAAAGGGMGALTTLGLMGAGAVARPMVRSTVNLVRNAVGGDVPGINGGVPTTVARRAATYVGKTLTNAGQDLSSLQAKGAPYQATGKPITAGEAMGPRGVTALSALARRSGTTGDAADVYFGDRRDQMGKRLLDDLTQITGLDPEGARGNIDALVRKGQMDATPQFDAVRAHPGPVWNTNLAALAERPSIKEGLKLAYATIKDAGKDPTQMGLSIDPDTGLFIKDPMTQQPIPEAQPTAEAWEVVRRRMGDLSKPPPENAPAKAKILAENAGIAKNDLTDELAGVRASDGSVQGGLIPGYRNAIDTAGDYLSAKGAFDQTRGTLFGLGRGNTAYDMSQLFDTFQTPGELSAARHAVASDIYEMAMSGRLTPRRWATPDIKAKLNIAFPGQAGDLVQSLDQEASLMKTGNQITPAAGSQTTPLREAYAEQDAVSPASDFAIDAAKGAATGLFHGGAHGAAAGVGGAVLKQGMNAFDAWARAPGLSPAARDEAGRLLMASPDDLSAYLQAYKLSRPPIQLNGPSSLSGGGLGGLLGSALLPRKQQVDPYQLQPSQ